MHCQQAKQQLNENSATVKSNLNTEISSSELLAHLQGCADCRSYQEDLQLTQLLVTMPVPPISADFADQALARAWETATQPTTQKNRNKPYTWAAVAASVLLVTLFTTQSLQMGSISPSPDTPTLVQVIPTITRPVEIRLVSKEALLDAHISIHWDKDVALTGYPDTESLSWEVPIAAGINQLSIPVTLKGANSGSVVIEVRSGNASKQLRLTLEPTQLAAMTVPRYYASL